MKAKNRAERQALCKKFWDGVSSSSDPDEFLSMLQENVWLMQVPALDVTSAPDKSPCVHALASLKAWGMVDFCLRNGASLEARDILGNTFLQAATRLTNHKEFASQKEFLWASIDKAIHHGARCETLNVEGKPLWMACDGFLPNAWTETFLTKGSPVNTTDKKGEPHLTELVRAACKDTEALKNLASVLRAGADPRKMGVSMQTNPLWNALQLEKQKVVELLMEFGADPHVRDHFARGMLHHAPSVMAVSWAQGQGLDINDRDAWGQTPLLFSMLQNVEFKFCPNEKILIEMIVKGASLEMPDYQGQGFSSTPLSLLQGKQRSLWPSIPAVLTAMSARSKAYAALEEMEHDCSPSP